MDDAPLACSVLLMTTTKHTNCTHPATKAARAACRKGKAVEPNTKNETQLLADLEAAVADYSSMTYDFERVTCDRCAGSGTYPSSAWNGVCLGCNGKGKKLTRAGKAAKLIHDQWITDHLTVEARTLKPGDKFRPNQVDGWKTVVEIDAEPKLAGTMTVGSGDDAVTTELWHIMITTQRTSYGMAPDSPVIRSATPAERNELIGRIAKRKGTILTEKA